MSLSVCVFCTSSSQIDPAYLRLAEEVGTELARRGCSLVSGGAVLSCMGAVAQAARTAGARTVGVIPEVMVHVEIADLDNDELVVTSDMRSRKAEMERRADAFLVLPGGLGTLEELTEIWTARSLGLVDKPLVVLDPYGFYDRLRAFVDHLVDKGFASAAMRDAIGWTTSVTEAFDVLQHAERRDLAKA
ncbi:TIGR00730 family Rossman fold protein [Actinomadura scrupuli]|uniref:LOG family protein n=1 Tax=Actinomadura scrupuli TaxID=559629 RepID=UPI003D990B5C